MHGISGRADAGKNPEQGVNELDKPPEPWWNSSDWLAAIVASSDDAIIGKTLDSVIRSWNTAAERIFGYSAAEIVGQSILTIIPPELQHEETHIVGELSAGRRIDHFETVRVTKDGRRIDVSLSVSPIRGPNGDIVGAAKIARDTTESNRLRRAAEELNTQLQAQAVELEQQVEEAQSLQEDLEISNEQLVRAMEEAEQARRRAEGANQAKSRFLTTMSHELRTPLNAIAGYVELLELELRGPLTTDQRADLDRIRRSQQVLLRLIEDLLDHAKLESGQLSYHIVDFAIEPLLQRLESFIGPLIAKKGVRYKLAPCDNIHVRADPTKVEQILLNLLSNSVKFTDEGSIEVTCEEFGEKARIAVADTGRGIPENMLERVFEPFVQVDSDLTRTAEGTGLGLSISRQLARGMGGDVSAARRKVGAEMVLTLPRGDGATRAR
jgi:PAS domain S-box-containing protein